VSETDQQVRDLVDAARRRDPEERAAFIDAACAGRPELRAAVLVAFDDDFATLGPVAPKPATRPSGEGGHATALPERGDEEQPRFTPNQAIGPYIIRDELGRGGMGVVYLADDTRLSRRVALKAIAPHLNRDPLARERLRREARIAAGLSHPGMATVYAIEEIEGDLYLACEYVPGKSLRAWLEGGALAMPQVVDTAVQLAQALAAAHAHGVTHRDLKPENIVRTTAGVVKILDFGVARLDAVSTTSFTPSLTQTGTITGTPAYMAPEQARGEAVDFRADLFAFGLIVYEMTTGTNPFVAQTLTGTIARILELEPAPLADARPDCPPDLARIVVTCLRKNPAERYASTEHLVADLARIGSGASLPSSSFSSLAAPAVASTLEHAPRRTTTDWWKIHHVGVIAIESVGLYAAWQARSVMPQPYQSVLWLAALACVISGASLRLHLLFTRRVHPTGLADQVRRSRLWLRTCAVLLCTLLLVFAGYAIGQGHPASVTTLVVVVTILVIAAFVIEPATTAVTLVEHESPPTNQT
jgi:serine/threonine protein kinase